LSFTTPIPQKSRITDYNPITPLRFSDEDDDEVENIGPMKTPTSKLNEVDFTPLKTPWRKQADEGNAEASDTTERNLESHETKDLLMFTPQPSGITRLNNEKSKLNLFLENNKSILQGLGSRGQTSLDCNEVDDEEKTPVTHNHDVEEFKRNNLINFITPFKSPIGSPRDITSPSTNQMNISVQDVDDFIDEVISNTSKTPKGIVMDIQSFP